MRHIQFEGGPYDGHTSPVTDDTDHVYVPMRSRISVKPVSQCVPSPIRHGIYRRDPLDECTFQWEGEA